jgi:hypothetical protein
MGSRVPGGVIAVAVIGMVLGCYLIYAGGITAAEGLDIASTGGEFDDINATLGGFWHIFGILYFLLGVLCFVICLGLLTMKEWGRRNGFLVHIIIAALSLIMGMIMGFFDIPAALPSFAVVAVSGVCGIHLWRPVTKDAFEFHGGRRGGGVEVYTPNVVVRHRAVKPAAPRVPANMRKCPNCDTVNPKKQDFCRMCGTELEKG